MLPSAVTTATSTQPATLPAARVTISCMRRSETMPSSSPVQAYQAISITSYQPGTGSWNWPRWTKSVTM